MTPARISRSSILTVLIIFMGCVEPYDPPYSDLDIDFLVVDGFLDSGKKTATVRLSNAVPLDTTTTDNPLRNAIVQLEGEDGTVLDVPETAAGVYTITSAKIETGKKFRLHVNTSSKEYLSDEVELRASPSLDSVNWRADARGVTVYVDSHDVDNSTRYYQWIYTETWEYNADQYSSVKFNKKTGAVEDRTSDDMVFICYDTETSTKVLVTTTSTNSLDVVNDFGLAFIPVGSPKISRLYSIEVEQRALDEQAYTYWLNLQKSTENLGGLFDPLPNEVTGNMHNVANASERVLGYFSGGEVQKKRIFIYRGELPSPLQVNSLEHCPIAAVTVGELKDYIGSDLYLIGSLGSPIYAYTTASGICIDCRLNGGVTKVPSFWPPR